MTTISWIDAAGIWGHANKHRLDHLLQDPIEASPAFIHALTGNSLNQFVFWERGSPMTVRGWAFVHGTRGACTWSILRGDEFCFETYLQAALPREKIIYEYIREEERGFYSRITGAKPAPFAWYYEITRESFRGHVRDPMALLLPEPFKMQLFHPARARDWFAFQGYPAEEPAFSIYPRLDGIIATSEGSIAASMHDGLSLLPFRVPEVVINGVKVAENDRGKGLCTALLRVFLDRLFSAGKRRAGLFVSVDNEAAMRCYERAGFLKKQLYYKLVLDEAKSSS